MGNKLYEESHIQAIANAIRIKNGLDNTYKVSEMASAIEKIQTGATEENRRVYTGMVTETYNGTGVYAILAKDDILAEHRNDQDLFVRVKFDISTAYSVVGTWAFNNMTSFPWVTGQAITQYTHRLGSDGSKSVNTIPDTPINADTILGVGCVNITEDGELRIYSQSNNYAIRPSNYKVIVEW